MYGIGCMIFTIGIFIKNTKQKTAKIENGNLATAKAKPSLLLKGDNPRLIDEWQEAPVLWDAVRTAVDTRQEEGLFILTGSTSVDESQIHHTGTGRISRMKMYPMSLYESKDIGHVSSKFLSGFGKFTRDFGRKV